MALRVRRLSEEATTLRNDYVRDRLNHVAAQKIKADALTEEGRVALDRFSLEWLLAALSMAHESDKDVLLQTLVKDTLDHGGRSGVVGKRRLSVFKTLGGLKLILVKEVGCLCCYSCASLTSLLLRSTSSSLLGASSLRLWLRCLARRPLLRSQRRPTALAVGARRGLSVASAPRCR